jgi:hypothetical protein
VYYLYRITIPQETSFNMATMIEYHDNYPFIQYYHGTILPAAMQKSK